MLTWFQSAYVFGDLSLGKIWLKAQTKISEIPLVSRKKLKYKNNPWVELWKWSPLFRSPQEIEALRIFLVNDPIKEHVLAEFATGFVSHFEYPVPEPWGSVQNYPPVRTPEGAQRFREAMAKQVVAGKMIGGKG